jgi:hypothetical protein
MFGHSARIATVVTALLLIATAERPEQDPNLLLQRLETAPPNAPPPRRRPPRAAPQLFSVASANFDATYYHLNLFIPMGTVIAPVDSIIGSVRVQGE